MRVSKTCVGKKVGWWHDRGGLKYIWKVQMVVIESSLKTNYISMAALIPGRKRTHAFATMSFSIPLNDDLCTMSANVILCAICSIYEQTSSFKSRFLGHQKIVQCFYNKVWATSAFFLAELFPSENNIVNLWFRDVKKLLFFIWSSIPNTTKPTRS